MAERVPLAPVQLTVHSMAFSFSPKLDCLSIENIAAQQIIGYIGAVLGLQVPVVSSTL